MPARQRPRVRRTQARQAGKSCQKKNKEVKDDVRTYKCAYHRNTQWRLPGDMPDMASDSGFADYSRCTDLEFHPVYGQENNLRKRGGSLRVISRRLAGKNLERNLQKVKNMGSLGYR